MPATAEKPAVKADRDSFNDSPAERQMTKNNKPEVPFRDYKITKITKDGEQTGTAKARNESEAWAVYCDKLQSWPSRHAVEATVVAV